MNMQAYKPETVEQNQMMVSWHGRHCRLSTTNQQIPGLHTTDSTS